MTDKEILVNMLREAVKKRYEQTYYGNNSGEYHNEFEKLYFSEDKNAVHIYNADDDCVNFYFDKNGKINFFD